MSKELLNIIDAVANEKEVERGVIIEALEAALAAATRKRYPDEEIGAKVVINPRTGEYKSFRLWTIVDDEAILENPDAEMRESVAAIEFPDAHLQVGDVHEVPIENEPFGRISAQQAKQIIIQKLREAERRKVYDQFIADEGTLVHGIVRRHERGNVIIDVNGAEATILRDGMIPRETLRIGDRIRGYLAKVNLEMRGPQLEVSRVAPEMLKQLFTLEVPEIGTGIIEIMGVARAPGVRAKIAVRTFDPRIDPVGACVGIRASRVQGVMNELAGECIDVILWDEDPETYVRKAMAPVQIVDTAIQTITNESGETRRVMHIAVPEGKLPQAVGRGGQNVRLASELTGWEINVLSEAEFEALQNAVQDSQEQTLAEVLNIDNDIAERLIQAGYTAPEMVAYAEHDELLAIEDFDAETVDALQARAADYLLQQAFVAEVEPEEEMQLPLENVEGIDEATIAALQKKGLHTQEDLAELAVDELVTYTGMDKERASALILKAREPWFRG